METRRTVDTGPFKLDPDGLIPLRPFAEAMGFGLPLYTTDQLWEDVVRYGPYELMRKLNDVVANALASKKADFASITFAHRVVVEEEGKAKKVRLKVMLYQTHEGHPWVMLQLGPVPLRSMPGRSTD